MPEISQVGDFRLTWGESVRWDDRRRRLYFVDCGTQMLHWLEGADPPLHSLGMPSLPTGVVLADDGRLVIALDDGLHVIDTDAESVELLSPYPEGLGGRANDANADLDGNLVTGTLNIAPGPGSLWWFSAVDGWRQLDEGISNANGPVVLDLVGGPSLVFADTLANEIYAFDYDAGQGRVGERKVFARTGALGGSPDGACADAEGGVWGCVFGGGKVVRHTSGGVQEVIETGMELPSDVTFGGEDLDRMFVTSIALDLLGTGNSSAHAGAVIAIDDTGFTGRPEPRFDLGASGGKS